MKQIEALGSFEPRDAVTQGGILGAWQRLCVVSLRGRGHLLAGEVARAGRMAQYGAAAASGLRGPLAAATGRGDPRRHRASRLSRWTPVLQVQLDRATPAKLIDHRAKCNVQLSHLIAASAPATIRPD